MSIFHLSAKNISKAKGRSAVQLSSYINGEKYKNERTGEIFKKERDDIVNKGMAFREDIPECLRNAEKFWNALEIGTSNTARLAKHIDAALPIEHPEKWQRIVNDVVDELMRKYNLCALQWAIHDKRNGNPHVHFLIPNYDYRNGKFLQDRKQGYVCRHKETGKKQIFISAKDIPEEYERIPVMDPNTGEQKLGKRNTKLWLRTDIVKNDLDTVDFINDLRLIWEQNHNKNVSINHFITRLSNKERGLDKDPSTHLSYRIYKMISEANKELRIFQIDLQSIKERIKQLRSFIQFNNIITAKTERSELKMNKKNSFESKLERLKAENYSISKNNKWLEKTGELSHTQRTVIEVIDNLKKKNKKTNKNVRDEGCIEK